MATRRSRIKAVANLPARRNRPLPINDIKREGSDPEATSVSPQPPKDTEEEESTKSFQCTESAECSKNSIHSTQNNEFAEENNSNHQSQCVDTLQSFPDRKSVIVAIDKDRQSVIVNRDKNLLEYIPEKPPDNEISLKKSPEEFASEEPSTDLDHFVKPTDIRVFSQKPSNSEVASETSSEGEVVINIPSTNANSAQSKRVPVRGRRPKPTVNLSAATRKRPANDCSSPCSPPANKLRGSAPFQIKSTENDNISESESSSTTIDKCHQVKSCDLKEQSVKNSSGQVLLPPCPSSPPPVSGRSAPSCKVNPNSSGQLKVPFSPTSKTKDPVPSTSNDDVNGCGPSLIAPHKETSAVRRKQSTSAQKAAAAKKNLKSRFSAEGPPPRSALTMFDLIFYNPSKNPMKSSDSSTNKSRHRLSSISSVSSIYEDRLNEESVDDVEEDKKKEDSTEDTAMPVPRVKVGPDGSLILDEQSLVIETTGTKKSREELEKSEVVVDTGSNYGHYKKIIRSKDWSDHETKKFYRALNVVGTDFSLMKPYFRNRTRRELKLKFKKEERLNPNLVNKALGEPLDFDITELEKECALEDEEEKRLEEEAKEKAAEKLSEKVAKDVENKVKRSKIKKKQSKRSVLFAEMGVEAESIAVPSPKTQGIAKKTRKVTDADTDYNILAEGVHSEVESSHKKTKRKVSMKTNETNREPKKIEDNPTNKPKPANRRRKKPEASTIASDSQRNPSETGDETCMSTAVIFQSTPHVSKPQASQPPGCSIPLPSKVSNSGALTAGVPTSGTRCLSATPLSLIRTVQASPQSSPPTPGFGMTTPVRRLLPSTPPLPRMEPGSIIVLKTPLPENPDRHILQVYMVTNTPPGNSATAPVVPGINLISTPPVQSSASKTSLADDSGSEKVLTEL